MQRRTLSLAAATCAGVIAAAGIVHASEKPDQDTFGSYTPVPDWIKPTRQGYIERGTSVFAESPDRIIYTTDMEFIGGATELQKGDYDPHPPGSSHLPRLMVLDGKGKVIEEWKQWAHLFNMPHQVQISPYDPERNVWVVDRDNSQIFKFSHDGKKLLMTLGEKGVIKNDDTHFGRPADISFAPDGSFYVADGYTNTRVIKFDKNGKRLLTWGSEGSGPGQFKVQVHDVAIDQRGRVYVADRGNERIQIFDANGKYLEEWNNIYWPSYIYITKDMHVWVLTGGHTPGKGNDLRQYDMSGHLLSKWGTRGIGPGEFDDPHAMSLDQAGNLYVANYSPRRVGLDKYEPKRGANSGNLIGVGFNRALPAATR